jgi:beta-1,4-mannosyltransferase
MYADDISDIFDVLGLDHDDLVHIGVVLQCLSAFVFIWTTGAMLWRSKTSPAMRSVVVLVLGDVGRSPRMMYHAESFARSGFDTFVVGYEG